MKQLSNFLLISGSGQNTGKTTLACQIISNLKDISPIGVKISPHFHALDYPLPLVEKGEDFLIYREVHPDKNKDSSRFLQAGAKEVFILFAGRESLEKAVNKLLSKIPDNHPVICESGGFAKFFKPGIHLFVSRKSGQQKPPEGNPDLYIEFDGSGFNIDPSGIDFKNGLWTISKSV